MKKILIIALLLVTGTGFFLSTGIDCGTSAYISSEELKNTWEGYKKYFIASDGRVVRPGDEGDTVSEGQAYAMLRAVWMDDKETFDRCYVWTEANLSRSKTRGDHLMAWHWKDGKVIDWMSASDSELDYALSLLLASQKWGETAPKGLVRYREKGLKVLDSVLSLETYVTKTGRLYLSPWIIGDASGMEEFPANPSYYSPGHFKYFYGITKDERWIKLYDTAYFIYSACRKRGDSVSEGGLVPDWCAVREDSDAIVPLKDKSGDFGWEALRVPIRVAMDHHWFGSEEAEAYLKRFSGFIESEWKKRKAVYCEYTCAGRPVKEYENPLFYSAYYCVLSAAGSNSTDDILGKVRESLVKDGGYWVYDSEEEYYVNSLAWVAEGFREGVIVVSGG